MITVGVIDVGSPKSGKLGWAINPASPGVPEVGIDLDIFIKGMADLARLGPVAIGFEAPMFIPLRHAAMAVLTGRLGEGARPWSAGAGATVTTAALAIVAYTLGQMRKLLPAASATMDWRLPPSQPGEVLFFEAFVSQASKGDDHAHDAQIAAEAAQVLLAQPTPCASAIDEPDVFSTLGAALLRTGWSTDMAFLSTPCLVVKPEARTAAIMSKGGSSARIWPETR